MKPLSSRFVPIVCLLLLLLLSSVVGQAQENASVLDPAESGITSLDSDTELVEYQTSQQPTPQVVESIPANLAETNQMMTIINERLRREIDALTIEQQAITNVAFWQSLLAGGGIALLFLLIGFLIGRRNTNQSSIL